MKLVFNILTITIVMIVFSFGSLDEVIFFLKFIKISLGILKSLGYLNSN